LKLENKNKKTSLLLAESIVVTLALALVLAIVTSNSVQVKADKKELKLPPGSKVFENEEGVICIVGGSDCNKDGCKIVCDKLSLPSPPQSPPPQSPPSKVSSDSSSNDP
jgi:hypothetical protein